MKPNSVLEREIKWEAPAALTLPDLRPFVGRTLRLPEEHLVTRYFDTPDRRLWEQGMTLRHRTSTKGDEEGVWTLKLPNRSAGSTLERTEVAWPGSPSEVPDDATALLRGVVRRQPLEQLTVLETTRKRLVLHDDRDHELAELDDDLVLVAGGPRQGTRFRQVELEFRDKDWEGHRVVVEIEKAGARAEKDTKLAKALPLPRPEDKAAIDSRSTLGDVVQASLTAGLERLLAHDWRLRLALPDPAARDVHQARVATRRLRSDLKTFGLVLDPVWREHLRSELKWYGEILGEIRDLDVLFEGLATASPAVRQRLAVQRQDAGCRLADVLSSERYVNMVDRLHAGSEQLPLGAGDRSKGHKPAADALPSLVGARWRAVRRKVRKAGRHPSESQLHQIRIKSKQLRYAAEAAAPVIGKEARRTASAAEHIQTVLGQHHDAVAAEDWLRREFVDGDDGVNSAGASPAVSFEVGCLVAEARHPRKGLEEDFVDVWKRLRHSKRVKWLTRR